MIGGGGSLKRFGKGTYLQKVKYTEIENEKEIKKKKREREWKETYIGTFAT